MCKYECVRRASKRLNFREVADEDDWNVYWTDTSVGIDRVAQMKKWQVSIRKNKIVFSRKKRTKTYFLLLENQSFSWNE